MENVTGHKALLRQLFEKPLPGKTAQDRMAPSLRRMPNIFSNKEKTKESAVMIVLFHDGDSLQTIFIKRPEYDGYHSAQVAFPGGKADKNDISLKHTAIRECREEIGVKIQETDIIGKLSPLHIPVSNIDVYPFVAYVKVKPELIPDPHEVAYTFTVPIQELLNDSNVQIKNTTYKATPTTIPFFAIENEEIWGATAMICAELLAILK